MTGFDRSTDRLSRVVDVLAEIEPATTHAVWLRLKRHRGDTLRAVHAALSDARRLGCVWEHEGVWRLG